MPHTAFFSPDQQEYAHSKKGRQHSHAGRFLCRLVLSLVFKKIVIKVQLALGVLGSYASA